MVEVTRQAEYERLNGKYIREAERLLAKKDYAQASERMWGAAAEIVKAVATKRGVELGAHASLWSFVERLHKENPDLNLMHEFSYAGNLHTNFYENWLSPGYVNEGLAVVKGFIIKLKKML